MTLPLPELLRVAANAAASEFIHLQGHPAISLTQAAVLRALLPRSAPSISALAERARLDVSTTHAALRCLKAKGMVSMIACGGPGRAMSVSVTSCGRRALERAESAARVAERRMIGTGGVSAKRRLAEALAACVEFPRGRRT